MSKGQPSDGARGNRLLGAMEAASLARIAPHLEPVVLKLGDVVCEAGGLLKHAYFPQGAVIFLGAGVVEAREGALGAAFDSEGGRDGQVPMLLLPRLGVVLHRSTNKSADAMAQCLADVAARIEPGAVIQRLSSAQEYELSHWEAEKYRQTLGVRSAAP